MMVMTEKQGATDFTSNQYHGTLRQINITGLYVKSISRDFTSNQYHGTLRQINITRKRVELGLHKTLWKTVSSSSAN
ncbi:hypothetical protein QJS04_geneDACA024807 [Acorus gramineus]|uniref:Uncharacterized protein n=1 Tax=Acorus gramineus TaxID=55184 RepID=A0AAV9A3T2_ACOGR|nr:hypothetical protein QJS04_geneDACA024807 [Acorus gramineus]